MEVLAGGLREAEAGRDAQVRDVVLQMTSMIVESVTIHSSA